MDLVTTGFCGLRPAYFMPSLRAEQLGMRFGRRILFRNMDFEVAGSTSLAVTGANGSGKSTLLRILAGVLTPTKGTAVLKLEQQVVEREDQPLHTGLVAPYLNVYDGFTARENLEFLAGARRLPEAETRIREILDLVSLTARADDFVSTYSSGMKQRVKYAAALLAEPPLLLLDEPTANLDVAGLEMVDRVMVHQCAAGRVLVVATNVTAEAERCDAVVRIEEYC